MVTNRKEVSTWTTSYPSGVWIHGIIIQMVGVVVSNKEIAQSYRYVVAIRSAALVVSCSGRSSTRLHSLGVCSGVVLHELATQETADPSEVWIHRIIIPMVGS